MAITLAILIITIVFFVIGKIRSDIVAICALVTLTVSGVLTPQESLSGFSNSVVIMMVGLFVVGGAVFQTGLAKTIGSKILSLAGDNELKLFILIMLVTSGIGAFVSNTGTVALMLPIVISMASKANISPARFLMPLAFASSMGGMLTLIGTPPNLVIQEELSKAGYHDITFFSFIPVGILCVSIGIILLIPLSKIFLVKKHAAKKKDNHITSKDLAHKYQLSDNLFRILVPENASVCNKKLVDLNITEKYDVSILEVRRSSPSASLFMKTVDQKLAGPEMELKTNDILYAFGTYENIEAFIKDNRLKLTNAHTSEYTGETSSDKLSVREIGIAEVLILPESKLINKPVKESNFRANYAVNVLGIGRKKEYILTHIKDIKIQAGDALLVQGKWEKIGLLKQEHRDWVVLSHPTEEAAKVTLDYKAPTAAGILICMVAAMVLNVCPPVICVLIAAILTILTGCFRSPEEAYQTISWESVVLIGAMLPMSLAFEKTGLSELISNNLVTNLQDFGPIALLAGIYIINSTLTLFISNTAVAVLTAPIALQTALTMGVSPYPFLMAVTVGASMCFASPFSTAPNALVISAGKYSFKDYFIVGLPLQILMGIIMIFLLPLIFPF
ncbi:MAG: SLC13 family permease [Tannerella sp.]|nr:SLC13 family permease [Tannerella sp.]